VAGELHAGDQLIARASAVRVQAVPEQAASAAPSPADPLPPAEQLLPPPSSGKAVRFALNDSSEPSFAGSTMEMRWLSDPSAPGPGRVWMRMRHPLLAGQPLTALTRLAGTADFCNGVSASLPFERFLFINADLTIHLQRLPLGEWIGLDARTFLHEGGAGLAEGVLHDERGPVGRAFQTLVVQQR
jgi:hypothetical protein